MKAPKKLLDLRRHKIFYSKLFNVYFYVYIVLFIAIGYYLVAISLFKNKFYTPDSWAYVDVARNFQFIGENIFGTRDFQNSPWVNDSFPFGLPLILSFLQALTNLPWSSQIGIFANLIFDLTLILIISFNFKRLYIPQMYVGLLVLMLAGIPEFLNDGLAGRSHHLSVLLLFSIVFLVINLEPGKKPKLKIIVAGVLAGTLFLVRFDSLLIGPAICLAAILSKKFRSREAFLFLILWFTTCFPWFAYSKLNFGSWFISDSSRIATSPNPAMVTDYSISDSPVDLQKTFDKFLTNIPNGFETFIYSYLWVLLAFFFMITVLICQKQNWSILHSRLTYIYKLENKNYQFLFFLIFLLNFITFIQIVTTGYFFVRYWILPNSLLLLTFIYFYGKYVKAIKIRNFVSLPIFLFSLSGLLSILLSFLTPAPYKTFTIRELSGCINSTTGTILTKDHNLAAAISAIFDKKTVMFPSDENMLDEFDWQQIIQKYEIRYFLITDSVDSNSLPREIQMLNRIECSNVYK